MSYSDGKRTLAETVYAEARGEPQEGWEAVAWTIKNRADPSNPQWPNSIEGVARQDKQFECWNQGNPQLKPDGSGIRIDEPDVYQQIKNVTDRIYDQPMSMDPTGGADHYNNPDKEGYPDWTNNVERTNKIGSHQFYKSKK